MPEDKFDGNVLVEQSPDYWLKLLESGDEKQLKYELKQLHPADIALLLDQLPPLLKPPLFNLLADELAADVLRELDDDDQAKMVEGMTDRKTTRLMDHLDSDDAADLLALLPDERAQDIIDTLPRDERHQLNELLGYEEESAGGIMAKEALSISLDSTVGMTLDHVRDVGAEIDDIYNVYLLDDEGCLVGFVSLRDLILSSADTPVSSIMETMPTLVNVNMDREEVAALFSRYDMVSAPVVNDSGRFLGRITHDDILDVMEEEIHEDIAHITGHREFDPGERSVIRNMRNRLPWLLLGLVGGIATAFMIAKFQPQLSQIETLVYFLPLVAAMGGNAGIQTSSLVVRGLATGEIGKHGVFTRLAGELLTALLSGLICGAILVLVTLVWQNDIKLAIVAGASLTIVIVLAASIGGIVPLILKRYGMDPALATGPFITTTNDILGLLIYLALASITLYSV